MVWSRIVYIVITLSAAVLSLWTAHATWKRRVTPGGRPFIGLLVAIAGWNLGAAAEALSYTAQAQIGWSKFQYLGIPLIGPCFLLFVMEYLRLARRVNRWTVLLFVFPLATMAAAWTNEWHGWLWAQTIFDPASQTTTFIGGPWYWANTVYLYGLVVLANLLLLLAALQFSRLYRLQALAVVAAVLIPLGASFAYLLSHLTFHGFDPTPAFLAMSGFLLLLALFRFRLLDLQPITSNTLLNALQEAVLVINADLRVADMNQAALHLFEVVPAAALGQAVDQVSGRFPELAGWLASHISAQPAQLTQSAGERPLTTLQDLAGNWYEVRLAPLDDRLGGTGKQLVTLYNVTTAKHVEADLARQTRDLKSVSEISLALATSLDQPQMAHMIVELTRQRFNLYAAQIYLLEADSKVLTLTDVSGPSQETVTEPVSIPLAAEKSLIARVGRERQGLIVNDTRVEPTFLPSRRLPKTRSEMSVPMIFGDQLMGVLDVQAEQVGWFSQPDLDILMTLAAQSTVALQNSRYFFQLLRRQDEISLAMSIARMGDYEVDLERRMVRLSQEARKLLGDYFQVDRSPAATVTRNVPLDSFMQAMFRNFEPGGDPSDPVERLKLSPNQQVECEADLAIYGQIRHLLNRAQLHRSSEGQLSEIRGSLQDITEQVESQAQLTRLAAIIDQASESIVLTDPKGRIVYVNPAFENVTGYTVAEALGQTPALLKSGRQGEDFYRQLWGTVTQGQVWQGVFINRRKDGSLYHEQGTVFPIKDPTGQVVNLAAVKRDITAQVEAEQALRERERYMRLLNEITRTASEAIELPDLLQAVSDQMGRLIEADACYLTLWDELNQVTIPGAASGEWSESYRSIKLRPGEPTLTERVLRENHWVAVEGACASPDIDPRAAAQYPGQSILALPLAAGEKKLGAALIGYNQPHVFTAQEIAMCEQAANQISLAIAKTYALEEAQRQAREAELMRQAGAAVASTLNQEEVIQRILEQVRRVIPYDSASVSLLKDDDCLEIVGGFGFADLQSVLGIQFILNETTPCTQVVKNRQPVILEDAPTLYDAFRHPPHDHIHGWLGIPLIAKDRVIGLIAIDSIQPGTFTPRHTYLAAAIAGPMAVALENTRLFEDTQRLAITDSLTGLYTRRHFFVLARQGFEYALRYQRSISAVMIDIDRFKHINDTYGHKTGDQVLQVITGLCRASIRKVDIIGRYGGEEFVILMPETNVEQAFQAAERLRQTIAEQPIATSAGPVQVTISLGLHSEFPDEHGAGSIDSEIEKLIDRADQALLTSKQTGRNRVTTWTPPQSSH